MVGSRVAIPEMSDIIRFSGEILQLNLNDVNVVSKSQVLIKRRRRAIIAALNTYFSYFPGPHK